MAKCYKIQGNKLIFENNGDDYIDDDDKKSIRGSFTVIEFPACYDQLYHDDFDACRNQLAKVTTLDFTKAVNINTIDDNTFTGAKSLEVVVLPKKVDYVNEFKQCPKLKEIHIYNLKETYKITDDDDKRLTIYASSVSSNLDCFDNGFLADVGILYVPSKDLTRLKKCRDEYDDELDIRPLPEGYSFPTEALSTPWQPKSSTTRTRNVANQTAVNSATKTSVKLEGINPYDENDEKFKYVVWIDEAGENKDALARTIAGICGGTLKKARDFVKQLDDLLCDNEVCSVDTIAKAQSIKQQLCDLGAEVTIRERNFRLDLDDVGESFLKVTGAIKDITGWGLKEAKDFVQNLSPLGDRFKIVDTWAEANEIKLQFERMGARVSINNSYQDLDDENTDNDENSDEPQQFDLSQVFGGPQYHCVLAGQSFGPVTIPQFANMKRFGIVDGNTLVWKEGMANWAIASTVADLQILV